MMSKNEQKSAKQFDRRSLLKSVAATGAMATIAAAHPAAAQAAPEAAKKKSWREKPTIDESLVSDGGTFDIVVVGGGTAGLMCARVAASKGASVAVIEYQAESKYDWVGTELGTINSQHAMSLGAPKIEENDFIREWARRNLIRHNPKRAADFAKNSGKVLDWVLKDVDKAWLAENSHVMSCPPLPGRITEVSGYRFYHGSTIFRKMTDDNGTFRWKEVMKIHYQKAQADGAKWFFQHHAEICDVDSSGAVTGVVAKTKDGKYLRFKARKGVALCAGDFSGSQEMVTEILDSIRWEAEAKGDLNLVGTSSFSSLMRDGSSIKLGMWAGGHIEIGPHSGMSSGDPGTGEWYLELDENGERFHDEAAGTTMQRPKEAITVTIHDANYKKVMAMMPPRHMATDTAHTINWPKALARLDNVKPGPPAKTQQQASGPGAAAAAGAAMQGGPGGAPGGGGAPGEGGAPGGPGGAPGEGGAPGGGGPPSGGGAPGAAGAAGAAGARGGGGMPGGGSVLCANTIEELVSYMDCYSPEIKKKALASIARYKELCERGADDDFGKGEVILKATALKDAPFYATVAKGGGGIPGFNSNKISPGLVATTGLDTDADGHVLNKEFKPIKGLYAAGNNAGGRFVITYQSPMAGISLGMAMTDGYLLGEKLAAL
jgi:hypothetical protein